MAVDKEALLAAVAAAGSQGRIDYEQAQAANAAAQAEAIRMALANGVASSAPPGAQAELARIISQPYQTSQRHLAENQWASGEWFGKALYGADFFGTVMQGLNEAVTARALAEAAAGGGSGGGGGGGGGDEPDPYDWQKALKDAFGSTEKLRHAGIAAEAEGLVSGTDLPRAIGVQRVADEFEIPDYALDTMFKGPKFIREGEQFISELAESGGTVQKFKKEAKRQGKQMPGNQSRMRKYLTKQAKQQLPKKRRRKRR